MKIQICSDLHLEFATNREWLKQNPLIPKGEILIIAGDTYYLNLEYETLDFIRQVSKDFDKVFLIPGNHEYYGGYDISSSLESTNTQILENVFMINNHSIVIDHVRLIFSTMWSNIQINNLVIKRGMADFRKIFFKDERFNVSHFNYLHDYASKYLLKEVSSKGKKIVITHHLPSYECNIAEFSNSLLNEAFCVEKKDIILNNEIDYWIYGHSHRNLSDFTIGNTKMVTNQFGYIHLDEHLSFNYEKVIEL